jgi:hypothetical protein
MKVTGLPRDSTQPHEPRNQKCPHNRSVDQLREHFREHPRPKSVNTPMWRWRESNPRPPSLQQDFSGRSARSLCSAPPVTCTSWCDGPSRCEMSRPPPRPRRTVSHLIDASDRAGDLPGLTELLRYLRSESELGATVVGAYFFCIAFFKRSAMQSSARFSCLNVRSRDHSPPSWDRGQSATFTDSLPTVHPSSVKMVPWPKPNLRSRQSST